MVLPVVLPMFTGTVLVPAKLIPVNVWVPVAERLIPCIVLPCTELAGAVADVVVIVIPVNGTEAPLKVNPAIVLLLIAEPPVVLTNEIALTAFVVALVIG